MRIPRSKRTNPQYDRGRLNTRLQIKRTTKMGDVLVDLAVLSQHCGEIVVPISLLRLPQESLLQGTVSLFAFTLPLQEYCQVAVNCGVIVS
jgi:hypothetical protein